MNEMCAFVFQCSNPMTRNVPWKVSHKIHGKGGILWLIGD
ncbi:hypothetical protein JCM19237_4627 [Photobacterium aphoticum]|uniref:Uncharacterized protein n=1 Tax=Photobacterium aphoticum TaxID=754436 RepID=A0A090QWD9_9GAMM|nr:hypothetical protein JCM19237_4627 [Photobacterium aphoticum]